MSIIQSVTMCISSIEHSETITVARLSFVTGGDEMIPDNESIRYEMEKLFTSTIEDESYIVVEREEDDEEEEE